MLSDALALNGYLSFVDSLFLSRLRKEIPMCSMKPEYPVGGKVSAYLKASKYGVARGDATGFVAPAPRSYSPSFHPPHRAASPASHTYATPHNNPLCSLRGASLTRGAVFSTSAPSPSSSHLAFPLVFSRYLIALPFQFIHPFPPFLFVFFFHLATRSPPDSPPLTHASYRHRRARCCTRTSRRTQE